MHELSITQSMTDLALETAKEHGVKKILGLTVGVGRYSGIVPEFVERCFYMLSQDTIAQGARLTFTEIPTILSCGDCGYEGSTEEDFFGCPRCRSMRIKIVDGLEVRLEDMEVE